ncbi:MAG: type II toxin-antitoxin system HipA family toxin [Bifidobacteriaceae bacterium]|jgi:serine/threonine-protein kinase HipA|nr:type II toxin-antitoxin system HipA family toxin [Bifidobacteriaceae bacterium]
MTQIHVYLSGLGRDAKVANLYTMTRRGRLTSIFAYDPGYLAADGAYPVDPALPLAAGSWPAPGTLPRAVLDSAPDRWGRMLVSKREAAAAREAGRAPRRLDEVDFLLGASDETRQGALRFALEEGGAYQHPSSAVPKVLALPMLLRAADQAVLDGTEAEVAIEALLSAGSASLGGARPKAAVRDGGRLHIAKFPHAQDRWDVMAWEAVALELARAARIPASANRLVDAGGRRVLLVERFDRRGPERLGYISALTLVGLDGSVQVDYLDVAQALSRVSAEPSRDLADLWCRIALSVAVHNTDDHLRNLGLLRARGGWRLAPAFDINPDPALGSARVTAIGGACGTEDSAQALAFHAAAFGLSAAQARAEARRISGAVSRWGRVAAERGLGKAARGRFAPVFEAGAAALATV